MRHHAALWQSRADGEYRRCARCEKLGYGEDAWHPATSEFWPVVHGRLRFGRCRACHSEVMTHHSGFVSTTERRPAKDRLFTVAELRERMGMPVTFLTETPPFVLKSLALSVELHKKRLEKTHG